MSISYSSSKLVFQVSSYSSHLGDIYRHSDTDPSVGKAPHFLCMSAMGHLPLQSHKA